MTEFERFLQFKQDLMQQNKEKNSERTLKYYEMVQEAIGREEYERSWGYLQSVMNYIETNEYITDKQCEICDRILEHPAVPIENEWSDYSSSPF